VEENKPFSSFNNVDMSKKGVGDKSKVTMTTRKAHMRFRLMTLDDPELL